MGTINDMIKKLDEFQKEIENIAGKTINVVPDENGMIDRECPNDDCLAIFKINSEDWENMVKDEEFYCPFCRNNSKTSEYFPTKQHETLKDKVHKAIMDNWHYNTVIPSNITSIKSSKEFELHLQCEKCNARYSVIGAAYFCPCCGHNSIEKNAQISIEKSILFAQNIDLITQEFGQNFSKDDAAILKNKLVENLLTSCIGTLQSYSETMYLKMANEKAPFNGFQNVDKSNRLWFDLKGQGYDSWLNRKEKHKLLVFTQKRHLLEHKGGIVDTKYLEITQDKLSVGDRIVVKSKDIIDLGQIILKIIESINKIQ